VSSLDVGSGSSELSQMETRRRVDGGGNWKRGWLTPSEDVNENVGESRSLCERLWWLHLVRRSEQTYLTCNV